MKKLSSFSGSLVLILTLLSLSACKVGDGADSQDTNKLSDGSSEPMTGKINNTSWFFRSGATNPFLSNATEFYVILYESLPTGDICNYIPPSAERTVLFKVPRAAGTYDLGLSRSLTFSFNSQNMVATSGRIVIDSASQQSLVGRVNSEYDSANFVDGKFFATVCR